MPKRAICFLAFTDLMSMVTFRFLLLFQLFMIHTRDLNWFLLTLLIFALLWPASLTRLSSGETFQCNALLIACCRHQISTCSYYKKYAVFLHFCFEDELIMGLLQIQENQNTRADGGPISIRRLCRRLDIDLKSTTCHETNIPFTSNVVFNSALNSAV